MKSLFRVYTAGRVLLGSFGSKFLALKAMRTYNAKLKPGERPAWVSYGPDHWRAKNEKANDIPKRGPEPVWERRGDDLSLVWVPNAVYWEQV